LRWQDSRENRLAVHRELARFNRKQAGFGEKRRMARMLREDSSIKELRRTFKLSTELLFSSSSTTTTLISSPPTFA